MTTARAGVVQPLGQLYDLFGSPTVKWDSREDTCESATMKYIVREIQAAVELSAKLTNDPCTTGHPFFNMQENIRRAIASTGAGLGEEGK